MDIKKSGRKLKFSCRIFLMCRRIAKPEAYKTINKRIVQLLERTKIITR